MMSLWCIRFGIIGGIRLGYTCFNLLYSWFTRKYLLQLVVLMMSLFIGGIRLGYTCFNLLYSWFTRKYLPQLVVFMMSLFIGGIRLEYTCHMTLEHLLQLVVFMSLWCVHFGTFAATCCIHYISVVRSFWNYWRYSWIYLLHDWNCCFEFYAFTQMQILLRRPRLYYPSCCCFEYSWNYYLYQSGYLPG